MSRMLNLVDRLLSQSRNFQRLGRERDALKVLRRLMGFRDLSTAAAEETQSRLARICLGECQFRQARRHLKAALLQQPQSARYHHLMAAALAADPRADQQRAAEHYRRSIQLDPDQPCVLSEYGVLAVRLGQAEDGLAALCRAVELAPSDPDVVRGLSTALIEVGRMDEARNVLRAALFRNSRDRRFRQLWDELQFQQASQDQAAARRQVEAARREAEGPTILPFVRPANGAPLQGTGKRIRRDRPSPLRPPHFPHLAPLPDRKHA